MKNIKAGEIILVPEETENNSNSYNTVWTINKRLGNKAAPTEEFGKIWFSSEPNLGVVEIDFEIADQYVRMEYIRDALMALTEWAMSGKSIYEVTCMSKKSDQKRIEIIERAGYVYRSGNREEEKYSVMKQPTAWLGLYIIIGLVAGLTLGVVFGNMTMGLIAGLLVGLFVGSGLDAKAKDNRRKVTGEAKPKRRVPVTDISVKDNPFDKDEEAK